MQKCPHCGYDEGTDWARVSGVVAVGLLYVIYIVSADQTPKSWRLVGLLAYLIFIFGGVWRGIKDKRNRDEYLRLHPLPAQRVKNHLKTDLPANSL